MSDGKKITFLLAIAIIALCIIASAGAALNDKDQLGNGSLGGNIDQAPAIGSEGARDIDTATLDIQASQMQVSATAGPINSCVMISSPGTYTLSGDILGSTSNPCIYITSSDVTLDGAGHMINGQNSNVGIYAYNPQTALSNVTVKNTIITNCTLGIYYRATILSNLTNNEIRKSSYGFYFTEYSGRNTFTNNRLLSNSYGFYINTGYNTFIGNKFNGGSYGIYITGSDNNTITNNIGENTNLVYLSSSNFNKLTGNKANYPGKGYGFYLASSSNNTLNNNKATTYYGFYLSSSKNNTLANNNASGSTRGFDLASSTNNTLDNNLANAQQYGIVLSSSNYNTIRRTTVNGVSQYGTYSSSSNNNLIYDNLFNNTNNLYSYRSTNTWNLPTKKSAINIVNGIYTAGNAWENPTRTGFSQICSDADRNGICDSANPVDATNIDNYPLVHHFDKTIPKSVTNLRNTTYQNNYIVWAWIDPSDIDFSYVKIYINGAFRTGVLHGVNKYNLTGLLPNSGYTIGTRTVDINGNENATIKTHTARTKPDSTLPGTVSGLHNTTYLQTSITWVWTDPSDYDLQSIKVYINNVFKANVPKGTKKYTATGLSPGTSYTISTRAQDTSGNLGAWKNNTVKTKP